MLLFQAWFLKAIRCFNDDGDESASFAAPRDTHARLRLFWALVPGGCAGLSRCNPRLRGAISKRTQKIFEFGMGWHRYGD